MFSGYFRTPTVTASLFAAPKSSQFRESYLTSGYCDRRWSDFAFIRHADPTKVRIGKRKIKEGQVSLLESTRGHVISLVVIEHGLIPCACITSSRVLRLRLLATYCYCWLPLSLWSMAQRIGPPRQCVALVATPACVGAGFLLTLFIFLKVWFLKTRQQTYVPKLETFENDSAS
ncbi:hypothetical protein Tco_0682278 [Tanacetum coccineum]|uniref:Uncharacterized protein n=1 Tax=Tanacetum coccineum TaxID=301880 RepID=A0ABQ4XSM2_9ASTR